MLTDDDLDCSDIEDNLDFHGDLLHAIWTCIYHPLLFDLDLGLVEGDIALDVRGCVFGSWVEPGGLSASGGACESSVRTMQHPLRPLNRGERRRSTRRRCGERVGWHSRLRGAVAYPFQGQVVL